VIPQRLVSAFLLFALSAASPHHPSANQWLGRWENLSNPYGSDIRIYRVGGTLYLVGNTSWARSQKEADRVGVNYAYVEGNLIVSGRAARFQDTEDPECSADITLKLNVTTLSVTDHGNCGGAGTSFTGTYHRKRR
jgi:hypothetical protein